MLDNIWDFILETRFNSLYSFDPSALHKFGAYQHLMNEEDKENLKWLHIFK